MWGAPPSLRSDVAPGSGCRSAATAVLICYPSEARVANPLNGERSEPMKENKGRLGLGLGLGLGNGERSEPRM